LVQIGKIQEITVSPSGLESILKIKFNELIGSLWCYCLLSGSHRPDESTNIIKAYIESSDAAVLLKVGDEREFNLSIIFVNSYDLITNIESLGFEQPIQESSHTLVKAIVKEVIDENTLLCDAGIIGDYLLVSLETNVRNIKIGDRIRLIGETKAEACHFF
jgi:hypothetical protein